MLPPPSPREREAQFKATVLTSLSEQRTDIQELKTDMRLVKERVSSFDVKKNGAVTAIIVLVLEIGKALIQ